MTNLIATTSTPAGCPACGQRSPEMKDISPKESRTCAFCGALTTHLTDMINSDGMVSCIYTTEIPSPQDLAVRTNMYDYGTLVEFRSADSILLITAVYDPKMSIWNLHRGDSRGPIISSCSW